MFKLLVCLVAIAAFASGQRSDLEVACDDYCTQFLNSGCAGASPWMVEGVDGNKACLDWCTTSGIPAGIDSAIEAANGNHTIRCRIGKLGENNCNAASITGGGECGGYCETYCASMKSRCNSVYRDDRAQFVDQKCMDHCAHFPTTGEDQTFHLMSNFENSVQCRIWHSSNPALEDPVNGCLRAAPNGGDVCVKNSAGVPKGDQWNGIECRRCSELYAVQNNHDCHVLQAYVACVVEHCPDPTQLQPMDPIVSFPAPDCVGYCIHQGHDPRPCWREVSSSVGWSCGPECACDICRDIPLRCGQRAQGVEECKECMRQYEMCMEEKNCNKPGNGNTHSLMREYLHPWTSQDPLVWCKCKAQLYVR